MNDIQNIVSDYTHKKKHLQLGIGVIREGNIEYYSFGNKKNNKIPPENRLYEIGSITKVFTSIILLEMERERLISLGDTVSVHITNIENDYVNKITLKHLATHTSGLPRDSTNLKPTNRLNPFADYTEEKLYDFLSAANYQDRIGSYEYSNIGMCLLGHILCIVSGSTYDDLLKRYITNPLTMDETAVSLNSEEKRKLLNGYTSTGKRVPHFDFSIYEGAGGIKSSLKDMCLFVKANMNNDNPLSSTFYNSHVPVLIGNTNHYLGWVSDEVLGKRYLWHNGGTYGFSSYLAFSKELSTGVVLLSNYCHASISIMDYFCDQFIKLIKRKTSEGVLLDTIGKEILLKLFEEVNG